MPELYTPAKLTIGEILSAPMRIEVPQWQRSYSWTPKEVNVFFDDVIDFSTEYSEENIAEQEYFLGSIVRVDRGSYYELLDGQQRLATSTILLSVIRDRLQSYKPAAASAAHSDYIVKKDFATAKSVYKLTLNEYDRVFFRSEVQEFDEDTQRDESKRAKPTLESHKWIRRAREVLAGRFESECAKLSEVDSYQWALRIQRVLTSHVSVVAITSRDEDSAASVFETLNDRGIGLSTPDLTRSLVLRRAKPEDRDAIVELWRDVLTVDVDSFLRHYWQSYNGDVKTRSLYHEIKKQLTATKRDSLDFSRDLQRLAKVYRDLSEGESPDDRVAALLDGLGLLNAKSLLPALLAGNDAFQDVGDRLRLLERLISLYVRHNAIGNLDNSRLETKLFTVAKDIRSGGGLAAALKSLRDFAPADEDFQRSFEQAQISRTATARFILRELEHYRQPTPELKVQTAQYVDVEHIYPRTPAQRWDEHDRCLNSLGNLTLLAKGENRGIKNRDFDYKRDSYKKSQVLLTRDLAAYTEWTPLTIQHRQEEMAKIAIKIW